VVGIGIVYTAVVYAGIRAKIDLYRSIPGAFRIITITINNCSFLISRHRNYSNYIPTKRNQLNRQSVYRMVL